MTSELVERLEGLLAKATPGKWRCDGDWPFGGEWIGTPTADIVQLNDDWPLEDIDELRANAALIVEAVNALPQLLAIAKAHLSKPTRPYDHDMSDTPLLDRLRMSAEIDRGGRPTYTCRNPDGDEAADRIEALEAENARLREALKPFAAVPAEFDRWQRKGSTSTENMIRFNYGRCRISINQFRAAAAALENRHG